MFLFEVKDENLDKGGIFKDFSLLRAIFAGDGGSISAGFKLPNPISSIYLAGSL